MVNRLNKTYNIDAETLITEQVKVTNAQRRSLRNGAIQVNAVDEDVDVVLRIGLDYNDPTAYTTYTLDNATVTAGDTNIYQLNGLTIEWFQLTLTSLGTTECNVVFNPDFGGIM